MATPSRTLLSQFARALLVTLCAGGAAVAAPAASGKSPSSAAAPAATPSATSQDTLPCNQTLEARGTIALPATTLKDWQEAYDTNNKTLQRQVRDALSTRPLIENNGTKHPLAFKDHYYSIVFAANGRAYRFFVHDPDADTYATHLPNVTSFEELFLSPGIDSISLLSTKCAYQKIPNPILTGLAAFFKQLDFSKVGPIAGFQDQNVLLAQLTTISFAARASLKISDTITTTPTRDSIANAVNSASLKLPPCAQLLVTNTTSKLHAGTEGSIPDNLSAAYFATMADPQCAAPSPQDSQLVQTIESRYREVAGSSKSVAQESSYVVQPLEHFALGVVSSIIISTQGSTRVSISNGNVQPNPLHGALNLAIIEYHPLPYDPLSTSPSLGERFRLFTGISLSPEFGLAAGAGFGIVRGLSIDAGYSILRVDTLKPGEAIGHAPPDPTNPLANGNRRAFFVGLGYAFSP